MRRLSLNRRWLFSQGMWPRTPDGEWVDLPHDAVIAQQRAANAPSGGGGGYFTSGTGSTGGIGCYRRDFDNPCESGERAILFLEGAYQNAEVFVNGSLMGRHPYGYTEYYADITDALKSGVNQLKILTFADMPSSRWYGGWGLYRPVWLLTGGDVHIKPRGVQVATTAIAPACLQVALDTVNHRETAVLVEVQYTIRGADGGTVTQFNRQAQLPSGDGTVTSDCQLHDERCWSPEDPYLYTIEVRISGEGIDDRAETVFGIRTVQVDAVNGFLLNGKSLKLKGGCVHHDTGLLGAAAWTQAETRKVQLLRDNGFNAVRTAHNPPSEAFLNACDQLGLLVMDEAFDCWVMGKNAYDYHRAFEEWWERDIEAMVRQGYNHASVVCWSTGNEVPERTGASNGVQWSEKLAAKIRTLDPWRPVTNGLCGLPTQPGEKPVEYDPHWAEVTAPFLAPLDIVGYNYLYKRYEKDHDQFPNRVMVGTESTAMEAYDSWKATERLPWVIGDFVWTALDYLGESGLGRVFYPSDPDWYKQAKYPWHQAYCGDIDICGLKRPQSYYRDALWGNTDMPYIAVHRPREEKPEVVYWGWLDVMPCWNWPEGELQLDVYSAGDMVELWLNETLVAKQDVQRHTATFRLNFQPGTLRAVAYRNGVEIGKHELHTAGDAARIVVLPEAVTKADGLRFVQVSLVDAQGFLVIHQPHKLTFDVQGAELLAIGSGDPVSEESFVGTTRTTFWGKCTLVLRAADGATANISVFGDNLPKTQLSCDIPKDTYL